MGFKYIYNDVCVITESDRTDRIGQTTDMIRDRIVYVISDRETLSYKWVHELPELFIIWEASAGTADPFGRGDGFDLDLAKVMCDVSVIPSIISPLEESEVPPPSRAAEYAAPANTWAGKRRWVNNTVLGAYTNFRKVVSSMVLLIMYTCIYHDVDVRNSIGITLSLFVLLNCYTHDTT